MNTRRSTRDQANNEIVAAEEESSEQEEAPEQENSAPIPVPIIQQPYGTWPTEKLKAGERITPQRIVEFCSRMKQELQRQRDLNVDADDLTLLADRVEAKLFRSIIQPFLDAHEPFTVDAFEAEAKRIANSYGAGPSADKVANFGKFVDDLRGSWLTFSTISFKAEVFARQLIDKVFKVFLEQNQYTESSDDDQYIKDAFREVFVREVLKSYIPSSEFKSFLIGANFQDEDAFDNSSREQVLNQLERWLSLKTPRLEHGTTYQEKVYSLLTLPKNDVAQAYLSLDGYEVALKKSAEAHSGQKRKDHSTPNSPPPNKKFRGGVNSSTSNSDPMDVDKTEPPSSMPKKQYCSWCKKDSHNTKDCHSRNALNFKSHMATKHGANWESKVDTKTIFEEMKEFKKKLNYPGNKQKSAYPLVINEFANFIALLEDNMQRRDKKFLYLALCLNSGKELELWLDNGARVSVIHRRIIDSHHLKVVACAPARLTGFGGSEIVKERAQLKLMIKGFEVDVEPYIIHSSLLNSSDVLIGMDVIGVKLGINIPAPPGTPILDYSAETQNDVSNVALNSEINTIAKGVSEFDSSVSKFPRTETSLKPTQPEWSSLTTPAISLSHVTAKASTDKSGFVDSTLEFNSPPSALRKRAAPSGLSDRRPKKKAKREHRDVTKQIRHTRKGHPLALNQADYDRIHKNKRKRRISKGQRILSRKQRRRLIKEMIKSIKSKYSTEEIPKSTDEIAAILREGRIQKEEAQRTSKNTPKDVKVDIMSKIHEGIPIAALSKNSNAMENYDIACQVASAEYTELNDNNTVVFIDEDDDDELFICPVEIIAEADPNLDLKKPAKWNTPVPKEEYFIPHELSMDQKLQIKEITSDFDDSVVPDENHYPMGQAREVPEFDIILKDGALERLSKLNLKPYGTKGELRKKMRETVNEMVDSGCGHLVPPHEQTQIAFPSFFVSRPRSNKLRMCIDYTPLNNETVPDVFPMPIIPQVIEDLANRGWISVLDLKSGYHQFRLSPRAKQYSVMMTPDQLFQFDVLGFGLRNAVSFFQRVMSNIFKEGIDKGWVRVYVDDIIVATSTFDEHCEALRYVFSQLRKHNLKAALSKCHFCLRQAKVLGMIVGADGVKPDPELIKAAINFPRPKTVKNCREFLGLAGHVRQFIQNFGEISEPLSRLTRKDTTFIWGEEQEQAFNKLKELLVNAPVLGMIDWNKDIILTTDASKIGAGAILSQFNDKLGRNQPIAYASWLFNSAQRNYCPTDRELLAIVLAVKKFRSYLYGRRFKVRSDHQSLSGKLSVTDPHGRIARWSAYLANFDLDIEYLPGKDNGPADALSRNINTSESEQHAEMEIAASELLPLPSDEEWVKAQESDIDFYPVIQWLKYEKLPDDDKLAKKIIIDAEKYVIDSESGILLRINAIKSSSKFGNSDRVQLRARRCVPEKFRKLILHIFHDASWNCAHLGRSKTYEKISRQFFFPDMFRYVAYYVKSCHACQRIKDGKEKSTSPLGQIPALARFDLFSMDLWGPLPISTKGNKYVLTVVDAFTKWTWAVPIPSKKADTVARALWDNVFRMGFPNKIIHDQGREFHNEVMAKMAELLHIEDIKTTAYHPQGNAFAERIHQFFSNALSAYVRDDQRDWDDYTTAICLAFNDSVSETTGFSPAQLLMGRDLRLPGVGLAHDYVETTDPKDFADQLRITLQHAQNLVYERIESSRRKAADRDQTPLTSFKDGDKVWLYVPVVKKGKVHKLTPYWTGPFTVVRRARNDKVYYLKNEFNEELLTAVSLARLKPYHNRDEFIPKPNFAFRSDVTDKLLNEPAVLHTMKAKSGRKAKLVHDEPELNHQTQKDVLPSEELINSELIFDKPKEVELTKVPLTTASKKLIGHEGYLSEDGKFVILKPRVAVAGQRTRKKVNYNEQ